MAKRRIVSQRKVVDPNLVGTTRPAGTGHEYLGTVESQWTCSSCGTPEIPGGQKNCPNCGSPKENETKEDYQPPDIGAPYLNPEQLAAMGVDPVKHESDETCPSCGSKLKPGTQQCPSCGSVVSNVARTSHICPSCGRETNGTSCPSCGGETQQETPAPQPRTTISFAGMPPISTDWKWPAIALAALALLGAIAFTFWPRQEIGTISGANWTNTIALEQYQYKQHGGWSLPTNGQQVGTESRVHHYDKVPDHIENQCHYEQQLDGYDTEWYTDEECHDVYDYTEEITYDDGTTDRVAHYREECTDVERSQQVPRYKDVRVCEDVQIYREEPGYATWYIYNIWEWRSISPVSLTGTGLNPQWPSYPRDANHRETGRRQDFSVIFVVNDKASYTYHPASIEEFQRYQPGSQWSLKRSGNIVVEVKPIEK